MAGVLVVDRKHAAAADTNPGTEAQPFTTIQAALDKAGPGDTVTVRAGVYREGVKFRRGGTYLAGTRSTVPWDPREPEWITLEAYGDERVVLDGSAEVPAAAWTLVPGRTNTYVAPFVSRGFQKDVLMVLAGDELVLPTLVKNADPNQPDLPLLPAMPGDGADERGWYYAKDKDLLYLNLDGAVPGRGTAVSVSQLDTGVDAANHSFVRIRKLEIRGFNNSGICVYNGQEFVVEDNCVHFCRTGLWGNPSGAGVIRRNTFTDLMACGLGVGGAQGTVIENNLVKRWHINPYRTNYYSAALMCNAAFGLCVRYNVITENVCPDAGGPWPDCASTGISLYGNALYRMKGNGFYIEAGVLGTVLRWNTVFENDNGITFRANCANVAFENYVFSNRGSGLNIGSPDQEDVVPKANAMMYNWVIDNGVGAGTGPDRDKQIAHAFDHNTYMLPKDGVLFQFEGKQYKDLESLRADLGQEIHGTLVREFEPGSLGLVTFRVPGTQKPWEPVPMFGNPSCNRTDVKVNWPEVYFWQRGSFRGVEPYGWGAAPGVKGMGGMTRGTTNGFVRQLWTSNIAYNNNYPGATVEAFLDDPTAARSDKVCLQVCAIPGKSITPEGLGYWSPDLPTVDAAQIDVSLWIKARQVQPASPSGGVYALVEFHNETGQQVTRQFVVGADDGQKALQPDFAAGEYGHRQVAATVTAPQGARWFRIGFGVRDAGGWASFDDVDIRTRPGQPPTPPAKKAPPIDPAEYTWRTVDLSRLLNRPLADEVDADGTGGWTDQGALMDLRNLPAGDQTYSAVPFRIEKGNACLIMRNRQRPSENLPASGRAELEARAAVFAFLHSGGWLAPDVQHAAYVIHYADGTKVEIPVIGDRNIMDWTRAADAPDEVKYDPALGLLRHAVTVPSPRFVRVNVWVTLWLNPHPEKELAALEVISANQGIPGLIAVSSGLARGDRPR
jgi:hypothetical protein